MIKRSFSLLCIVIFLFFGITDYSYAASYSGSNIVSNNIHDHAYTTNSHISNSYLSTNQDGTFTRVENFGDIILVEKYNSTFKVISQSTVPFELSYFGGFFSAANYNYLLFGQDNYEDKEHAECIRIVQYTKDWKRNRVYSIGNCNTSVPFYNSNTSFSEYGDNLFIRCGHLSYKDNKGMRTQGPLTISIKQSESFINDVQGSIQGESYGSISNIGATYIDTTNGCITTLDHSLTNPYGALVSCYKNNAGSITFESNCQTVKNLGSRIGLNNNVPEFSLGGYEISSQYFLIAANTGIADGSAYNKNICIMAVPRNSFTDSQVKLTYLTGFAGDTYTAETPYIVKISPEKFCVLWEQRDGFSDLCKTFYTFIDANANRLTDVSSIDGCLSDCQPILYKDKIIWYTTNGDVNNIYSIPTDITKPVKNNTVYNNQTAVYKGVDFSNVYNFEYYKSHYPDVRVLYGNSPDKALEHFINTGMSEGRQASDNFNVSCYKANYSDLRQLYGDDLKKYYVHFALYGSKEGRNGRSKIYN